MESCLFGDLMALEDRKKDRGRRYSVGVSAKDSGVMS